MILTPLHTTHRKPKTDPETHNRHEINPIPTLSQVWQSTFSFLMDMLDAEAEG
jgi:hypothetical protein